MAYAEQFQRFFPLKSYTLPITDAELEQIDQSPEVGMGRRSEIVGAFSPLAAEHGVFVQISHPEREIQPLTWCTNTNTISLYTNHGRRGSNERIVSAIEIPLPRIRKAGKTLFMHRNYSIWCYPPLKAQQCDSL